MRRSDRLFQIIQILRYAAADAAALSATAPKRLNSLSAMGDKQHLSVEGVAR